MCCGKPDAAAAVSPWHAYLVPVPDGDVVVVEGLGDVVPDVVPDDDPGMVLLDDPEVPEPVPDVPEVPEVPDGELAHLSEAEVPDMLVLEPVPDVFAQGSEAVEPDPEVPEVEPVPEEEP
jgi:hypothetical protein